MSWHSNLLLFNNVFRFSLLHNKLLRSLISVPFMLSVSCSVLLFLFTIHFHLTFSFFNCNVHTILIKTPIAKLNAIEVLQSAVHEYLSGMKFINLTSTWT